MVENAVSNKLLPCQKINCITLNISRLNLKEEYKKQTKKIFSKGWTVWEWWYKWALISYL